jgi:uncharacterized membrane protein YoaK (UPF0700 family)
MASLRQDVRLLILAASAGSADGWSYLGLGHAFVANMTGNTVLLGIAVFQNHGDLLHPVIALIGYAAGAVIGTLMAGKARPGSLWPKAISWTLMLEALLLIAAEAGWIVIHLDARHSLSLHVLLGIVALAVGMQSAAMVQLKIPGIVTTYITGTWTTMMTGLVHLVTKERRQTRKQDLQLEERLWMQAGVLSVYFLSAVLTGWLFRYRPVAVGAIPGLSVLLVAAHGLIYND